MHTVIGLYFDVSGTRKHDDIGMTKNLEIQGWRVESRHCQGDFDHFECRRSTVFDFGNEGK